MKLLLREYLAAMRERRELDALIPDILSELGYLVFAWPQVGTSQFGVDVGAVSPASAEGGQRVYLFSIKRGDLTRQAWNDGSPQSLRPSLDEIIDAYIPTRLPPEYAGLPIVICPCFGGIVQDAVATPLAQFTTARSTDRISFEQWNGPRIADALLAGPLSDELMPKDVRKDIQKCVAFLDEPDVAYGSFSRLAKTLAERAQTSDAERVRAARQIYVSASMASVWGREIGNLEGPYRITELALLHVWDLIKPLVGQSDATMKSLSRVLHDAVELHLKTATDYIATRIKPLADHRDALAAGVRTRDGIDINLALFEAVGRIAMTALWMHWLCQRPEAAQGVDFTSQVSELSALVLDVIEHNAILDLPIADEQNIDLALVLFASLAGHTNQDRIARWLERVIDRLNFAVRTRGLYPMAADDYRDLLQHRDKQSDEDFEEATNASVLVPLVALWAEALRLEDATAILGGLHKAKLAHMTTQLWMPDDRSETAHYLNSETHGRVVVGLPIGAPDRLLTRIVDDACTRHPELSEMSAIKTGFWPIILSACRHWRLPMPPHLYIHAMTDEGGADQS